MPTNGNVSCRYVAWLIDYCTRRNIPERYLLNHIPLTTEQLSDPNGTVDWNTLVLLFNNLGGYLTDAELIALGRVAWQHADLAEISSTAHLATTALEQINLVFGERGLLTMALPFSTTLNGANPQHIQIRLTMSPGFSACKYFQHVLAGQIAGLPSLPGVTTEVTVRHLGHGADYHLFLSGSQNPRLPAWQKLARMVRPLMQPGITQSMSSQLIRYQQHASETANRLLKTEAERDRTVERLTLERAATGIEVIVVGPDKIIHEASSGTLIGQSFRTVFPAVTQVPFEGTFSTSHPLNGKKHIRMTCATMATEPGFHLVVVQDATWESDLADANDLFMAATTRLADGVLQTDDAGWVTYANRAAVDILGDDPTGSLVSQVIPPCQDNEETEIIRPDGSTRIVLVRVASELYVLTDRTEHHRLESARADLEQQLQSTQRIQSVGELAGGIAHDFNNLLVVINGYAELGALPDTDAATMRGYMSEIRRAGEQAVQMTQRLLTFSRGDGAATVTLNLNELVNGTRKIIERLLPENIQVRFLKGLKDPHVRANAGELEQILVNLAVNARDAMQDGGELLIAIGQRQQQHDDGSTSELATISVEDSGSGISESVQQEIFKPFFTTKERGQGTGLGLSVVASIVRRLGGSIELSSTPDVGSRFEIRLPLAMPGRPQRTTAPANPREVTGHETILLAEDNRHVRGLAELVLGRAGYQVLLASDGVEAVSLFRQHSNRIDLTIVDVVMPRMGGREVTAAIRQIRPDALVLFTSGYGKDEAETGLMEAHFMAKPYGATTLKTRVREVLDRVK